MYLSIMPDIAAIDVAEDIWLDCGVIKRCVKVGRLLRCSAGNLDLRKFLVPCCFCTGANLVKIPARGICL